MGEILDCNPRAHLRGETCSDEPRSEMAGQATLYSDAVNDSSLYC